MIHIYHILQPQPRQGRRTHKTLCGAPPTPYDNSYDWQVHGVMGDFVVCEQCLAKREEMLAAKK